MSAAFSIREGVMATKEARKIRNKEISNATRGN
jgi:hypothetical protein